MEKDKGKMKMQTSFLIEADASVKSEKIEKSLNKSKENSY